MATREYKPEEKVEFFTDDKGNWRATAYYFDPLHGWLKGAFTYDKDPFGNFHWCGSYTHSVGHEVVCRWWTKRISELILEELTPPSS